MKLFTFFVAFLFLCVTTVQAQIPEGSSPNIVPNPGFEKMYGKLANDKDGSKKFARNMSNWNSPTRTTPDLKIVLPSTVRNAKRNKLEIDAPHSGIKMVAILTHNPNAVTTTAYREYIQVKLDRNVISGKEYYFEMWVCRARLSKYVSNNLGFLIKSTKIMNGDHEPLTGVRPVYNWKEVINKDGREWVRLSTTFKATYTGQYLVIGNFFGNDKLNMIPAKDQAVLQENDPPQPFDNAYYLIDDVTLVEMNYVKEPEPEPVPEVVLVPAPEPELVAKEEIKVGQAIKLDRVFFETAKWGLLNASFEQLDQLVTLMNDYPSMNIEIRGHTDSRGGSNYNQKLSENRTKSVFEYLTNKGIDSDRMKYIGYGEARPIADNSEAEGRQLNRRVEFVVTKIDAENTTIEQNTEVKPYTDKS